LLFICQVNAVHDKKKGSNEENKTNPLPTIKGSDSGASSPSSQKGTPIASPKKSIYAPHQESPQSPPRKAQPANLSPMEAVPKLDVPVEAPQPSAIEKLIQVTGPPKLGTIGSPPSMPFKTQVQQHSKESPVPVHVSPAASAAAPAKQGMTCEPSLSEKDVKNVTKIQSLQRGRQVRKEVALAKKKGENTKDKQLVPAKEEKSKEEKPPQPSAVAAPAESATPVPSHKTAESASLGLSKPNVEAGDRFDAVEQEFQAIMGDHAKLKEMWRKLDFNGNGKVSLAEVDKMMVEQFPVLNHKAALMRAFQKTTLRDGDGDSYVEKTEFIALLRNVFYFNKAYVVFESIDSSDDRRINLTEFHAGSTQLGLKLSEEEAKDVFAKLDANGGGQILFDEFCAWLAINRVPVNGEVQDSFVKSEETAAAAAEPASSAASLD
jgi:Ca2+-binding EF-hand superfamily protein